MKGLMLGRMRLIFGYGVQYAEMFLVAVVAVGAVLEPFESLAFTGSVPFAPKLVSELRKNAYGSHK
jgi:hypothetical protein